VEKKMPPFEEMVRMRIVLSVAGMDAVTSRRDLVYKTAEGEPLKMDVYAPAGPARARPAVLLVHGGPIPKLGAKNMGVFQSYGELLAASGFVAVAFDHRFLAPSRLADAGSDVADLIAHVRTNAVSLGIDPERIAIWAFSGGGPFLAAPLRERPVWLRAVLAFYAVLDLQQPPPGTSDSGVGPEMREALRESGWGNYSLFLAADGTLVGYLECDDFTLARQRMAVREINDRWQAEMRRFFQDIDADPDQSMTPIPEIFHLP